MTTHVSMILHTTSLGTLGSTHKSSCRRYLLALYQPTMPSLAAVLAVNSRNAPRPPTVHPVAVVVGATSGIGRGVVESIARHTNGSAHIVLVGRNKDAADEIIAGLPQPVDGGKYEFVPCDVSSMKQVGAVTRDLASRLDKINYLAMSPGFLSMGGRTPTEDGVDRKVSSISSQL
jgi:hypothetical protein